MFFFRLISLVATFWSAQHHCYLCTSCHILHLILVLSCRRFFLCSALFLQHVFVCNWIYLEVLVIFSFYGVCASHHYSSDVLSWWGKIALKIKCNRGSGWVGRGSIKHRKWKKAEWENRNKIMWAKCLSCAHAENILVNSVWFTFSI